MISRFYLFFFSFVCGSTSSIASLTRTTPGRPNLLSLDTLPYSRHSRARRGDRANCLSPYVVSCMGLGPQSCIEHDPSLLVPSRIQTARARSLRVVVLSYTEEGANHSTRALKDPRDTQIHCKIEEGLPKHVLKRQGEQAWDFVLFPQSRLCFGC